MKIVIVNTNKTGDPTGWWHGKTEIVRKCDYLVEEQNGEIKGVYEFSGISTKTKDNKFSFKGLKEVTAPIVIEEMRNKIDVSRKQGEQNSLRYCEI